MLQNPSKYHPNPLSHFLALHNSAAAHHAQHQQNINNNQSAHHLTSTHHLDGVNTSLDVGKSFTIAAILGLQKNVLENNQKDFNNVMNLSLNHNQQLKNNLACINNNNMNNNNNNNNNTNNNNNGSSVNSFNCDSMNAVNNVVNRYMPASNVSVGVPSTISGNHLRINHFGHHATAVAVSAAAVAAAAVNASGAPSALQSLQQLHQHHAQQQASLSFQRDSKIKNENISGKKSSLKSKRVRTIFTPEQLERLEAEFERQQYMVGPERLYLAHTLQLTEAQVKVWFQNRRIKWRKHHLEITQQRLALLRQTQITTGEDAGVGLGNSNGNCSVENTNNINCNSENEISQMNMNNNNQHNSESDLSVCNDSMDAESGPEADDT